MRRVVVSASMAGALGFWVANALAVASGPAGECGINAFLGNIAIAITFVGSVSTAGAAYALVLGRGNVLGSDVLAGICRRTIVMPFALGLGVLLIGSAFSALALRAWYAGGWGGLLDLWARSLLPVGVAFALMGSFAGNLAGSVTLDARDLGRITRVNLLLLTSTAAFWLFLMWVVFHLLREAIASSLP
jgi:hypothetical protein